VIDATILVIGGRKKERGKRELVAEVADFVPVRRSLTGSHVQRGGKEEEKGERGGAADLLTLLQLFVRCLGGGGKKRGMREKGRVGNQSSRR